MLSKAIDLSGGWYYSPFEQQGLDMAFMRDVFNVKIQVYLRHQVRKINFNTLPFALMKARCLSTCFIPNLCNVIVSLETKPFIAIDDIIQFIFVKCGFVKCFRRKWH